MFGLWNLGLVEDYTKIDAETKEDLEGVLRRTFVDKKQKLVSVVWLSDFRDKYSMEVIRLGLEEGYLRLDSFTNSYTEFATTIDNYKLTKKGKEYFGLLK